MICAQYVICWTGPPVTPAGTALQLECGVGRHQCCSQPAQVHCVHFNHLVCVPSFFALTPLSSLFFSPVSPTPSLPHFLPPSLPPSLPLSCPPVVMYMYTSRDICGKLHILFILPVLTCWSHECLGQYAPLAERRVVGEGCSVAMYY